MFRSAEESVQALVAALNTPAGVEALQRLAGTPTNNKVVLYSRSGTGGCSDLMHERTSNHGANVAYNEVAAEWITIPMRKQGTEFSLITHYPTAGQPRPYCQTDKDTVTEGTDQNQQHFDIIPAEVANIHLLHIISSALTGAHADWKTLCRLFSA